VPKVQQSKGFILLFVIFLIIAITAVFLIFYLQTDPVTEILKNDQLINILFVLEDSGEVLTTQILMYYPVAKRTAMFEIPGNTGAIYSTLNRVDRIDAVFKEKGIKSYTEEIQRLTGVQLPFSIVISKDNFAVLSDFLGGLRVFIPSPVEFRDEKALYLLPSGSVNLDGDKIISFLDYKHTYETDSIQQERRQAAVLAFLSALSKKSPQILADVNFKNIESLFSANIDKKALQKLLLQISLIDAERLVPQTVTGSLRSVDGKSLLFPYYDGQLIKDVCKQTMSALVSSAEGAQNRIYVLEIQNGTTVQGLAKNTAALLQSVGYDVLSMVNAPSNAVENTYIIDHIGNNDAAKGIGSFIRCESIVTDEIDLDETNLEAASLVDFTIVLGSDFDGRYVR